MMDNINIVNFVSMMVVVFNASTYAVGIDDYDTIVDIAFAGIEAFSDEVRNTVISMLSERVDDVDNVDMRVRLLRFIEDHKIRDTTDIGL